MELDFRSAPFDLHPETSTENGLCRLQLLQLTSALHARRSGYAL